MRNLTIYSLALALTLSFTGSSAHACGGVSESTAMCVALPVTLSTFLQSEEVREMLREKGTIRHLSTKGSTVEIAISDSEAVRGKVKNGEVTSLKKKSINWSGKDDFNVGIEQFPALAKLLIGTEIAPELARIRAEKSRITSLYLLGNGSPLIRVNGTGANSYSIEGIMRADGELEGIVIK